MTKTESGIFIPKDYTFFTKPTEYDMSMRKLEGYKKLAEIRRFGINNPTKFMEIFLGVELLDSQNYVFMNTWNKPFALWVESRNAGKSTMLALYFMTKGLLFNNYRAYICAGTSDQSIETFRKIEDIAQNNIESMTGLKDIFRNEVVINQSNSSGFLHNPMGFSYELYNGSFVKTLNSNVNAKRGKRAEAVCFDEGGWLSEDVYQIIEPYTAQNKDFKMGGDIDVSTLPKEFPNQLLYASSASSIDTYFFQKYKDYSKKMILGHPDYFVADINCDVVIRATKGGKIYPASLLTQEKIDSAMRENREKAMREYKNIFTTEGGDGQIIKRAQIVKNSTVKPPLLHNDNNKRKIALAYDPARSLDNSVVLIGEFYLDDKVGWKMNIVNCVSFVDLSKKLKTPMRTPEQIDALKQLILDYNGEQVADYENITSLLIDAGSGGGGVNIADYLMSDWNDKQGRAHRGLIDKEFSSDYTSKFPNAVNKVKLLQPSKYKTELYEALIEMMELDLISFTADYDNKGYLTILDTNEGISVDDITTKMYKLSPDEELALKQIDALKEEVVNMYRYKSNTGKDRYDLASDKIGKLHDDRSYCLALLAWQLFNLRREHITKKTKKKFSLDKICDIKKPNIYGSRY